MAPEPRADDKDPNPKESVIMAMKETDGKEILEKRNETDAEEQMTIATPIIEEITIEELAVDGICGIY